MAAPAVPPTAAPMMAPAAVLPEAWPMRPPRAPPVPAPIKAPLPVRVAQPAKRPKVSTAVAYLLMVFMIPPGFRHSAGFTSLKNQFHGLSARGLLSIDGDLPFFAVMDPFFRAFSGHFGGEPAGSRSRSRFAARMNRPPTARRTV